MPETIYETTNRIRDNDGFIYDIRCELQSQHNTIFAHVTHNSPIDGKRVFVPIQFSWRWAPLNSETDFDLIAGWACRLHRNLPANHSYKSKVIYDPDEETLNRLLKPGKKNRELVDRQLLQLLKDFYVADSRHKITVLSIFMSLEIEREQILMRLEQIQDRGWIRVSAINDNKWLQGYSISAQGIEKIEERLKLTKNIENRYFKEVEIEQSGDFIFVIMPFRESEFEQAVFNDLIKPVVEEILSIPCVRVDDDLIPERIDSKIYTYIKRAKFLIAEMTTNNPNVIYELAIAHMLNKRTIILTQNNPPKLPFDFDKFPATIYANKEELKKILPKILKSTFTHT